MEFEAFVFVVIVVAAAVIAILAVGRSAGKQRQRICPACGAPHPAVARFCSRCGKSL